MVEKNSARYAVIGHPVMHSLSPRIHQAFAVQTKQSILFERIDVDPAKEDALQEALTQFFKSGGRGCNITLPFKEQAFQLAESVSPAAEKAQAASCLWLRDDGVLFADNYDGLGLIEDLKRHHDFHFCQKNILIVGAGGAVRGILPSLLAAAPKNIVIANRTPSRAQHLIRDIETHVNLSACALDEIPEEHVDLIIHATSFGHEGGCPFLPSAIVSASTVCYDLSYGEVARPFLSWASQEGAGECVNGIGMLIELNASTFYLWRGVYPETHSILEELGQKPAATV